MHHEFAAPVELQDTIKCFWYDRRDSGEQQTSFQVQPDGYAEIIFYFGSLHRVRNNCETQILPSPFIMGLLNQPAVFYTNNRLEILAVRCFPWTVFDLLGLIPGKKSVHVFEHAIAQLQPALCKLVKGAEIEQAVALLKQYFLDARSAVGTSTMLYKAGIAMQQANGTIPVSQVAEAAHATVRTLERNFKRSSGHTVKDVSALMRFEQVRNRLWHYPETNLSGLAYEFGYTDQAHLSKEFKKYSGSTPAAFARRSKKGQSEIGTDFVAFIQA